MSFTYADDHADAISRMRWLVGDTVAPGKVPDATYTAALAAQGDETAAAQAIAAGLAARYALQPDRLTSADGSAIAFSSRVGQLNKVAGGTAAAAGGAASAAAATSGDVTTEATW